MFYILLPTREHVFSSYIYFKLNNVYVSWCLRSAWSSYLISVLMQWWEKNKVVSCLYPVKVSILNNLAALKKLEFLFFFIQVKINTNISSNIFLLNPNRSSHAALGWAATLEANALHLVHVPKPSLAFLCRRGPLETSWSIWLRGCSGNALSANSKPLTHLTHFPPAPKCQALRWALKIQC